MIIDPYHLSLQANYYYPLLQMTPLANTKEPPNDPEDEKKTPERPT
jgi:hypothetical protein